jgi:hypothetical protein
MVETRPFYSDEGLTAVFYDLTTSPPPLAWS